MLALNDIKTRLTEIQAAITGVKKAFIDSPPSLAEADLPLFLNFTGPATTDYAMYGDGEALQTRDYLMRMYVTPVQAGESGEAEKAVEALIPAIYGAFFARPGLSGTAMGHTAPLAGIREATIISDTGVSVFTFAGAQYLGTEFKIRVNEEISFTYATGE